MRHAIYGDLESRDSIALVVAMGAMGLDFDRVAETPALSLVLAARAGCDEGPYLRTPEGFVLGELAAILDHLERVHPERSWRPATPVRRVCARLLEDWIELWLPLWPERAAAIVEALAAHLDRSAFLLGEAACRADGSLAAWIEADVLADAALRPHVERRAPSLIDYVRRVRTAAATTNSGAGARRGDDAIPVSLLALIGELAHDYHAYLEANRVALVEGEERALVDLGFGPMALPAWRRHETRRAAIGREIAAMAGEGRRAVRQMLEPLGAWRALAMPPALGELELGDPRSL